MVMQDCFGLDVSASSDACVEAVSAYYDAVLAYKPFDAWIAASEAALASDAASPMARVLAADCAFCRGEAARAVELLKELASEADKCNEREALYLMAWQKWVNDGDPAGCHAALLQVAEKFPSDLFVVKRGQIMGLILGDPEKIASIVKPVADAAPKDPPPRYLMGMWAFALEQQDLYEEAEAKVQIGLDHGEKDAWLDHGYAHALYFQGNDRLDDAKEFLESRGESWSVSGLHPFLYTHNWWHLALLYVENRDFDDALKVFDERLWADKDAAMRADPDVQINALGLLWRLDTRGESASSQPRWTKVLQSCSGGTLPAEDGAKGKLQHRDLLLDVLLVRALCVGAKADAKPLDGFLASVAAHAEELKAGPAGSEGRAEAYCKIAKLVAELFRSDQSEAGLAARQAKARKELHELEGMWKSVGGSKEQRGVLQEAAEGGPIVCGAPEVNYSKLFF
eukprot:TRINITY_DN75127_c0_g1_i1.p1 TRINITY_DN75127_c0_g1~~TRINITY_DN75127_c0_g1_i1.p1  ORF type:complete len:454 (-),score=130.44 TRINITY_DN75127_c0_g1_i1:113-1474(-)